jgi:hypothetical protein
LPSSSAYTYLKTALPALANLQSEVLILPKASPRSRVKLFLHRNFKPPTL